MTEVTVSTHGTVMLVELPVPEGGGDFAGAAFQETLAAAWRRLDEDEGLRVAVLWGSSGAYDPASADTPTSPWANDGLPLQTAAPIIAAIDGPCIGAGFELALACDLRVAGAGSSFGFPDSAGPGPYRVASVLLPRITFAGLALELLMTDRMLDAAEAARARLVSRVVRDGQALDVALEMAESMAERLDVPRFKKQRILSLSGVPLVTAMGRARRP